MTSTTLTQSTSILPLTGRNAVVTGAASGIGAAIAERLAADGASVALLARRTERLDDLSGRIIADGGTAFGVGVDVTQQESVDRGVEVIAERLGRVDLVVNAAGVMLAAPIEQARSDDWARMIDTNLTGTLRLIGAFTPGLIEAAAAGGTADLVNISSIGSHLVFPGYGVYGATKAAVTQLSNAIRADLSPYDVRVTNVEPGLTESELGNHLSEPAQAGLEGMVEAIGQISSADVADLVAYVVSRRREVNLSHLVVLPTRQA
jgi:NADP-dependent 3-hydroxy acid dehydrogenase YdfG